MQNKYGGKWEYFDIKSRDSFAKITKSEVKIAAGLNMNIQRIKVINKNINYSDCPLCKAKQTWEYAIMCDKNKQIRNELIKNAKEKFKIIIKKHQAKDCEKKIVEEIDKDLQKYFNN